MKRVLCECGAVLLDDVSDEGVLPVGATEPIPFRRKTDHVVCSECHTSYEVAELQARYAPDAQA